MVPLTISVTIFKSLFVLINSFFTKADVCYMGKPTFATWIFLFNDSGGINYTSFKRTFSFISSGVSSFAYLGRCLYFRARFYLTIWSFLVVFLSLI